MTLWKRSRGMRLIVVLVLVVMAVPTCTVGRMSDNGRGNGAGYFSALGAISSAARNSGFGAVESTFFPANNTLLPGNVVTTGAAVSTGSTAFDPVSNELFISEDRATCGQNCNGPDQVGVMNAATDHLVTNVTVGTTPSGMAYDTSNGDIYVGSWANNANNYVSNNVTVIFGSTNSVVKSIPAGGAIGNGVMYEPANHDVYVAGTHTYNVSVINSTTNTVVQTVNSLPWNPEGMAYDPSTNEIFLVTGGSGSSPSPTVILDAATNTVVKTIYTGWSSETALYDAKNGQVYVSNVNGANLTVIDGTTDSVVGSITVGSTPAGMLIDPATGLLYVAVQSSDELVVINPSTDSVIGNISVGSSPGAAAYNSITGNLYVTNAGSGSVSIITTGSSIGAPTISSFTATPSTVTVGQTMALTVSASGGNGSLSYAYTGLPPGCTSANTASLSCTPTTAGTYILRAYVNDSTGHSASATASLTVTSSSVPTFTFGVTPTDLVVPLSGSVSMQVLVTAQAGFDSTVTVWVGTLFSGVTCSTSLGSPGTCILYVGPGSKYSFGKSISLNITAADSAVPGSMPFYVYASSGTKTVPVQVILSVDTVVGVQNTVVVTSLSMTDSTNNCFNTLFVTLSQCMTFQQNTFLNVPSASPAISYWVQNAVEIGTNSSGDTYAGAYLMLWKVTGASGGNIGSDVETLASCNGVVVSSTNCDFVTSLSHQSFPLSIKLDTQVQGNQVVLTNPFYGGTWSGEVTTGAYLNFSSIAGTPTDLVGPQLVAVGAGGGTTRSVAFESETSGSVQSSLETSSGSWLHAGAADVFGSGYLPSTEETSSGLFWFVGPAASTFSYTSYAKSWDVGIVVTMSSDVVQSVAATVVQQGKADLGPIAPWGATLNISGADSSDGKVATVYVTEPWNPPNGTHQPSLQSPVYWGVALWGVTSGTAELCLTRNTTEQGSPSISVLVGGSWDSPSDISEVAALVCISMPVSWLNNGTVAVGTRPSTPSTFLGLPGSEGYILIGVVVAVVAVAAALLLMRKRSPPAPAKATPKEESKADSVPAANPIGTGPQSNEE